MPDWFRSLSSGLSNPQPTRAQTMRLAERSDPHGSATQSWNIRTLNNLLAEMSRSSGVGDTPQERSYFNELQRLAGSSDRSGRVNVRPQLRWYLAGDLAMRKAIADITRDGVASNSYDRARNLFDVLDR